MKKLSLIIVLLSTISLSASAQWWNVLKKHERLPAIILPDDNARAIANLPVAKITIVKKIALYKLQQSDYSIELAENTLIKTAQHNMRFRIYDDASYNFSELAKLFIKQNRLSEAKWYLLQSNAISRQQNDDRHTIANLMQLALIKANMGDAALAQQDLAEAYQLADGHNWCTDLVTINKEVVYVQQNKNIFSKKDLRYDTAVMAAIAAAESAKKAE